MRQNVILSAPVLDSWNHHDTDPQLQSAPVVAGFVAARKGVPVLDPMQEVFRTPRKVR